MKNINRRNFLKQSALATAAMGLSAKSWSQVAGANEDIRIAVVGFHGRGDNHISEWTKMKGVRLVALCDVDKKVLDNGVAKLKKDNNDIAGFIDIRKLLESKNLDAISIATPNHWHALAAIWGIQAGKDVYLEKPVSHNVWEGRKIVEAARKYNKIVQTGTQSRSSLAIREAIEWVKAGNLGAIKISRGLCYKPRPSIGKTTGPQPVPESVDYNLWSGPAPLVPPRRNSSKWGTIHYDWHWFWNYGNGDMGNQGIHQMDIARRFIDSNELSPRIFSVGGRLGYEDDGETPNTIMVYHDYGKVPLLFEVRGLPEKTGSTKMDKFKGADVGNICHCENGYLVITHSYGHATAYDNHDKEIKKFEGEENHFANFIKAVRSRKVSDLNADILEGHLSSALCHTGNISYRTGKQEKPEKIKEALKSDKEATETFERMASHLEANGVDLTKTKATLGTFLKMDTKAETFTNNSAANKLLRRDYREPFVVPEKV
ncbi:MAG: Gfo/Idh/MocA family oxidoreductase [Verrucomicrobiota bacterium]|nr:Gfo/Idh/MocA family oxidoreductase [Verrucomicrobiota bacterium]